MNESLSRRGFLVAGVCGALGVGLLPGLALARADTDRRLLVVLLRGGLDGLAAVPPYADPHYRRSRGELALPEPGQANGVLDLDGHFGLHPGLKRFHRWYGAGEAAVVHAVASPYRRRSHFDAQNLLENGTGRPFGADDGWLNRAIAAMPAHNSATGRELGVALGHSVPLMLRGGRAVGSWAPSQMPDVSQDTLDRITDLYADDAFLATRLARAIEIDALAPGGMPGRVPASGRFRLLAEAAAGFLAEPDGPRIALLETGGWDTHANQGAASGQLATRLGWLDEALGAFRSRLGGVWSETVIVVVSEFGRTVAVNGTRGTDHGTAGAVLLAGGAVRGGQVVADWPGLAPSRRHEGRDLAPTSDVRSVFKAVLAGQFQLTQADLGLRVFPGSGAAPALDAVMRTGSRRNG